MFIHSYYVSRIHGHIIISKEIVSIFPVHVSPKSIVWRLYSDSGKTSITTSRESDKLWCGLFTQQARPWYYVCNKFIYHYNKSNVKQMSRVKLKLRNLYNTPKETTFCAWWHIICCRSLTNVMLLFDHLQCHCTIVKQCFLEKRGQEILKLSP
jgi:hypothetical protein